MAVTLTVSNEFKFEKGKGMVDFSSDSFKIILMESGFVFDPDADGVYADISAEEITSAGGYTVGGYALSTTTAWNQDNANDRAYIEWTDKVFTASGAAFDTFCAAIIYDDDHGSDVIVGCIEFGTDIDVPDAGTFTVTNMAYQDD